MILGIYKNIGVLKGVQAESPRLNKGYWRTRLTFIVILKL